MVPSQAYAAAKLAVPKNAVALAAPISDAAGLENKIRERAYQLYEDRGREPGKEQQDWAQAEHEVLNNDRR
jgi:hypothetical protein